ncbi:MAG: D-alanyl-D-alanine carboxypeptidase/D-alanyl-D-alanine-endopeptidase [Phycisphaeraceae bacterium]|nr:D-alanyl-D-alanine carboxypeptidase/D-alanyl-D-alanine-endopeptidase [Phycisphaeraceae bacterium]
MSKTRCLVLAGIVALLAGHSPALGQPLQGELDILIGQSNLRSSKVGVVLYDPMSRTVLAEESPDERFIPASNMKMITSGAALAVLGKDYKFTTRLERDGDTLFVIGAGDPGFGDPKALNEMGLGIEDLFAAWVEAVKSSGGIDSAPIREIVIDDRWFDSQTLHPDWPKDQLNRWYCAEVSGLNFFTNVLAVYPSPTKKGEAPSVEIEPFAPWYVIRNNAKTSQNGSNTIWVSRPDDTNEMTLFGDVRWAAREPVWVSQHDMPIIFGRLLSDRLNSAGLGHPAVRRVAEGEELPPAKTIAVVETPMRVALERCNTDSYNLYAESMLKGIAREVTGQPGSWNAGSAILRMILEERLGPGYASQLVASDGSGMSRGNGVTPRLMTAWLSDLYEDNELRGPFLESLARPGETGTLRKRFTKNTPGHEVYAKTGYLDGVSSISGYVVDDRSGAVVVFSVLVNDIPTKVPIARVKDMQERIVLMADEWLGPAAPRAAGPSN